MKRKNRYERILEEIFRSKYRRGARAVEFEREDMVRFCGKLGLPVPKNLGDLIYSFRHRASLPRAIQSMAGPGQTWIIRPAGRAKYRMELVTDKPLLPNPGLMPTKIPDSTPGVVAKYGFSDEQALLAKLRYNRLLDIFTGVTCYSLQNHLRTTVPDLGQIETDEIYVGLDKRGVQYVFPIQAKGLREKLGVVQIEQDFAVCSHKLPNLVCRPIGAQLMRDDVIALFEFGRDKDGVGILTEKHYSLVPPDEVTEADLQAYRKQLSK